MNLVLEKWNKNDIAQFRVFEQSLKEKDNKKCEWEQKIVCTRLECFGKTSEKAKAVAREIRKGNAISFVQNLKIETHLDSILVSYLISSIKDFDVFEKQLDVFTKTIDNWASCDTLNFSKHNKRKLFELSQKYLTSDKLFVRRVGVRIYFELIKDEKYLADCFHKIDSLKNENEYYVNMCASWLLCECFIKNRDETLKYFERNKTNSFIINKAISKCRDSFRVVRQDKNLLLKFKRGK